MFARIFTLLLVLSSLIFVSPVWAETISTPAAIPAAVSPTSPLYTDLLLHNMFHSFSCLAIGQSVIGQPCLTYQFTQSTQGAIQGIPVLAQANLEGGALGAVTGVIGGLYQNPPIRTADYLASVGQGLGIVKTANAQVVGSGAKILSPILKLWQVSRNISYILMIIIFLVIGLMIMFRNKINPQTVISAQAALPGLIIGLVMITFSYFFAGLISDMAFVSTNVVGYYFAAAQGSSALEKATKLDLSQTLSGTNILGILGPLTGVVRPEEVSTFSGKIFDSLGGEAQGAVRMLVFWISSQFVSQLIPTDLVSSSAKLNPWLLLVQPLVGLISGGIVSFTAISPLLGRLLSMAAALALIYAMIKLLFKLITAWLTIIFLTITAPFQFLFASLPGRQGMATGWMLNLLGNILIFPAVIAVIYFVAFILGDDYKTKICPATKPNCLQVSASNQMNNSSSFISPAFAAENDIIGSNTFPLFGDMDLSFVKILLAFGALMALPAIPDIIIRNVGKAGQTGQMIGQEIMGGSRFGQGYAQRNYMSGLELGKQTKEGLFGKTGVDASGRLNLIQEGLLRRTPGEISKPVPTGSTGRWWYKP